MKPRKTKRIAVARLPSETLPSETPPRETRPVPPDPPRGGIAFYAIASVLLLVPCFWQSRIQAGDLSSHIYNTWLTREVVARQIPGVAIVRQSTNVLFDWLLAVLSARWGMDIAQRVAVSLAVLVFFWGAYAWLTAVTGRQPRDLAPALAVLAFGWVFHAGFFNFYLSLGLCFWAMAVAWPGGRRRLAAAAPLVIVAWIAHNLPVAWMAAIASYTALAPRLTSRQRSAALGALITALLAIHAIVRNSSFATWDSRQLLLTTGTDQAWIFDDKYLSVVAGLSIVFAALFLTALWKTGWRAVTASIPFHLWVLTAAGVAIVPTSIDGYGLYVAYIADRMSLPAAVCLCVVLASVRMNVIERYGLVALMLAFFGFLYRDGRILNEFEDQLQAVVAQVPERSRVISAIGDTDLHLNAMVHMIDRACVGRCYSYANYEASTGNFRLRAVSENPVVAATYAQSWLLQNGRYKVQPRDVPLYEVNVNQSNQIIVRSLQAGERTNLRNLRMLPDLF